MSTSRTVRVPVSRPRLSWSVRVVSIARAQCEIKLHDNVDSQLTCFILASIHQLVDADVYKTEMLREKGARALEVKG